METPSDSNWERFFSLIEVLEETSKSQLPAAIAQLTDDDDSIVVSLVHTYFELPPLPESEFPPGTRFSDRYTLTDKLGQGGMGMVYRAQQDHVARDVALKVITPRLVGPDLQKRFAHEIQLLGKLEHPNLIHIYDADIHREDSGASSLFFTMQLIEGLPLNQYLKKTNPGLVETLQILIKIARGLQFAHDHHIIHRDLKPHNIFINSEGEPIILDFGLATLTTSASDSHLFSGLSGTPTYMAPEQFRGTTDEFGQGQSLDIYALGVIAFEALSGSSPFPFPDDPSFADIRDIVLKNRPTPFAKFFPKPEFKPLSKAIHKCLRRNPADRYFTVSGFSKALERILQKLSSHSSQKTSVWKPSPNQIIPGTEWTLQRKIGEGGIGDVWLAQHPKLPERVFKFCLDPERARSLKREFGLFRLLKERIGQHPHLVRLHDVSLDDEPTYLAMDYIEGGDLASWSESQGGISSIPLETRLDILIQTALTVQAAHDCGILHCDLKPSNLLVKHDPAKSSTPHIYVADFGIGQLLNANPAETQLGFTRTLDGSRKSSSGEGSQLYLSPEQLAGQPASVRSDIYSLGVILFQLISGDLQRPLTIDWQDSVDDPLLRNDLEQCFKGNPKERFPSAGHLAKQLTQLEQRHQERRRDEAEIHKRERAAYRRGLLRAGLLALTIIASLTGLSIYSYHQSQKARKSSLAAQKASETSRFEAASAMRLTTKAGRSFESEKLLLEIKKDNPDHPRLSNDLLSSRLLSDLSITSLPITPPPGSKFPTLSPNLRWLAYLDKSGKSHLIHKNHSNSPQTIPLTPASHPNQKYHQLQYSPDSKRLALIANNPQSGIVDLFSLKEEKPRWLQRFTHASPITVARFHPKNHLLALGDQNARITLLDLTKNAPPVTLFSNENPFSRTPNDLAFRPGTTQIAASSDLSNHILLWDWSSAKLIEEIYHSHQVTSLTWDPLGEKLAATCLNKHLYLHHLKTPLDQTSTIESETFTFDGATPLTARFSSLGDALAVLTSNQQITYLKWSSQDRVNHPVTVASKHDRLSLAHSDQTLVQHSGNQIHTWNLRPGRIHQEFKLTDLSLNSNQGLTFSPDESLLIASYNIGLFPVDLHYRRSHPLIKIDGTASAHFSQNGTQLLVSSMHGPHLFPINSTPETLTLGPNHNLPLPDGLGALTLLTPNLAAYLYKTKILLKELNTDTDFVILETNRLNQQISPSPHPSQLLISAKNQPTLLLDSKTGTTLQTLPPGPLTLHPQGHTLAILQNPNTITLWKTKSLPWTRSHSIEIPARQIHSLTLGKNHLFIAHDQGKITVLNLNDHREEYRLKGGTLPLTALALSPTERHLAASNLAGRVHLWDLSQIKNPNPSQTQPLPPPKKLTHHLNPILRLPAQKHYQNLVRIHDDLKANPTSAKAFLRRGSTYHNLIRIIDARKDYQTCLKLLEAQRIEKKENDDEAPFNRTLLLFSLARTYLDDPASWNLAEAKRLNDQAFANKADPRHSFLQALIHLSQNPPEYSDALARLEDFTRQDQQGALNLEKEICRTVCYLNLKDRHSDGVSLYHKIAPKIKSKGLRPIPIFEKLHQDLLKALPAQK